MKTSLNTLFAFALLNCHGVYQESLIIDDNISPSSLIQITPSSERGKVGVHYFPKNTSMNSRSFWHNTYKEKSWIITNWGDPDAVEFKHGREYLIYFSSSIGETSKISEYGNKHVKLGYKKGHLVYVEAVVPNAMEHSGKDRVVLSE